jgi:flagellar basal-body rod modification protein FlgD
VVDGNRIQYNGSEVKIKYTLNQPATSVRAEIYTEMGEPVRTISLGYQSSGDGEILWDGKDNSGNPVEEGSYRVQLTATDEAGNPVAISSDVQSRIVGIKFEDNITYLILENGMRVSLSEIKAINEGGV